MVHNKDLSTLVIALIVAPCYHLLTASRRLSLYRDIGNRESRKPRPKSNAEDDKGKNGMMVDEIEQLSPRHKARKTLDSFVLYIEPGP